MKNSISIFLIGILFSISSCITTKTYTTEEKKMRIGEDVFIIKTNGEKITGKKISHPSSFSFAQWRKIDNQKIEAADMSAYQDKNCYYVKFENHFNSWWIKQLKRGRINLYHYQSIRSRIPTATETDQSHFREEEHFVYQKDNGELYEGSIAKLAQYLKDKPAAYNKFILQFGDSDKKAFSIKLVNHPKELFEIIDIYNSN